MFFRPIWPKWAIPHPITIQNMKFKRFFWWRLAFTFIVIVWSIPSSVVRFDQEMFWNPGTSRALSKNTKKEKYLYSFAMLEQTELCQNHKKIFVQCCNSGTSVIVCMWWFEDFTCAIVNWLATYPMSMMEHRSRRRLKAFIKKVESLLIVESWKSSASKSTLYLKLLQSQPFISCLQSQPCFDSLARLPLKLVCDSQVSWTL